MKYWGTLCVFLFAGLTGCRPKDKKIVPDEKSKAVFTDRDKANKLNALITAIRDEKLPRERSGRELKQMLKDVGDQFRSLDKRSYPPKSWIFPLKGYSPAVCLPGIADEGYVPGRYDMLDGNKHSGHAALDLFIKDKDQDDLDDETRKKVNVVSLTAGVVVAVENKWDTASPLRGGKYMWIYDPQNEFLIYYAHCEEIDVEAGELVYPGYVLGTCGRTGLNAFKKRSPTHLHLTVLSTVEKTWLKPINPYPFLLQATNH